MSVSRGLQSDAASTEKRCARGHRTHWLDDRIAVFGVLAAFSVGCYFRLIHLLDQIPFHDEWHALEMVAREGFVGIVTSWGASDHSIPITLYFESVARTIGLAELTYRAPFAIAACAGLVLLPALAWRHLTTWGTVFFSWLLAVSPILVFHGRTARPYGITVVAAVAAILLFETWRSRPQTRIAVGYVVCCVIVGWAMPVHLPFALAPAFVDLIRVGAGPVSERGGLRVLFLMNFAVAASLSILLGPALLADWSTLVAKSGQASFGDIAGWPTVIAAFGMAGRREAMVTVAVAMLGAVSLLRKDRRLIGSMASASVALVAAVLIVRPFNAGAPMVLTRYLLPVIVVFLLLAGEGLLQALAWLAQRSRSLTGFVAGLALLIPLVNGPLPSLASSPDSFSTFHLFVRMHYRDKQVARSKRPLPEFYRQISQNVWGRGDRILEAPYSGRMVVPYGVYQQSHRLPVVVALTDDYCGQPMGGQPPLGETSGLRFRKLFWLGDLDRIREERVRWIVLHRQPEEETPWPDRKNLGLFDFESCLDRLTRDIGAPVYTDSMLVAFDLARESSTG